MIAKILRNQSSFTLAEVLVSVGILTITMSAVSVGIFNALGTEKGVVDDGLAINELRKGFSWFAEDVMVATGTNLYDEAPPVAYATLTWTDQYNDAGTSHTASYQLVGDRLVRIYDGESHTVAHRVVSVGFSRSGKTVTAEVEVESEPGATRTLSISGVMRPTGPSVDPVPVLINSMISLDSLDSLHDPSDPRAPAGVTTVTGSWTNASANKIVGSYFQVIVLEPGAKQVLNCDGGPGGVGCIVSIPYIDLGPDGILSPSESFSQFFEIGLDVDEFFSFFVDAYGIPVTP